MHLSPSIKSNSFIHPITTTNCVKVEAHPIPEHMRPRRVVGRAALVGDAAGYVTKCSGEGIYFAAKSGRMAAEAIVKLMAGGSRLPTEKEIKQTYIRDYDRGESVSCVVILVVFVCSIYVFNASEKARNYSSFASFFF